MAYTVKQLSSMAGVTVRTLHYYDEIDLLSPAHIKQNGYRYYDDESLYRLQQILFFRELEMNLNEIREIMDNPLFDALSALQEHRDALEARSERLNRLITTIDNTILDLIGEQEMDKKQLFAGFSEEEEKHYQQEASKLYGEETVSASYKRWNSYSEAKKQAIKDEGNQIYADLVSLIDRDHADEEVQAVIAHWHEHLKYFYIPSVEVLRGLGQLYTDSPDFSERFKALHADLPGFMREAINIYCDQLEAAG